MRILLAAALLAAAPLAAEELPRGRLIERIVCADHPEQSYALYLPPRYAAERPGPILYALDARGRAPLPIERFREAADEQGWIVASSYNSRSDTRDDPNTPAFNAMWNDTHRRVAIDDRRIYVTGFSGGARGAVAFASNATGVFAGVIGCGAGFPGEDAPIRKLAFPYFGTVGDRDFNYYEMRRLDERLDAAGAAHRIEVFDGAHDWPPAPLAREAVSWMEVQAMKAGKRPRDTAAIADLLREDLERARALESSGRTAEASVRYAKIAEDFEGLTDASEARAKATALGQTPLVRKALAEARRRDERDRAALRALFAKLNEALNTDDVFLSGQLAMALGIPAWKRKAESADSPEERRSAERILANLRVQTSFYMPEELLGRGDVVRARALLSVAAAIDPDDPRVYYNLAAAEARAGDRRRALAELHRAVEKGFRRFELLDTDPDFASVRDDPAFRAWLAEARASAPPAATPTP